MNLNQVEERCISSVTLKIPIIIVKTLNLNHIDNYSGISKINLRDLLNEKCVKNPDLLAGICHTVTTLTLPNRLSKFK